MKCHLRFDVKLEWLKQFDFDKLKCLNDMISKTDRWNVDTQWYIKYVEYFYHDKQFNIIYEKYIKNKNKFQLFFNESYDCLAEIFLFNRFLQI